ncbi:MAG: DUF4846 domain-containing protein [Bacteroidales bacterium]|jgi:hypothetical protein|nr:DUF4846 domain-containing protein [Bacteroidales bacterium]
MNDKFKRNKIFKGITIDKNPCLRIVLMFIMLSCGCLFGNGQHFSSSEDTVCGRISTPSGYVRDVHAQGTWKYFLQHLPLKEASAKVVDYRGYPIENQKDHAAVINYDVGNKDLQQCADAIIRLRAEYLFAQNRKDEIHFHFTGGHLYKWTDHAKGIRPQINGNNVTFGIKEKENHSYENFRKYLDIVFTYAGTVSLYKNLKKQPRQNPLETGDIIIKSGSPGHAIIVVDRAKNAQGEYIYLLAQSFMPAQSIHIINSGTSGISPWFRFPKTGSFDAVRYFFSNPEIIRF